MTKKLLVVFASGLVLSILLLSLAWVVGGQNFVTQMKNGHGWHMTFDDDDDDNGHLVMSTRTLAFDDTKLLEIDGPVTLNFQRSDTREMTVKGPAKLIQAVRWENGRLWLTEDHMFRHHGLELNVTGPTMPALLVKGFGNVELKDLDQPTLDLRFSGAGNLDASGRANAVTLTSSGAGNMDLSDLDAGDATIKASGAGNVEINARGKVDVDASGVGNVTLHRKPAQLTTRSSGIGSIDQDY